MTALVPVLDTFIHDCIQVLDTCALHNHQVLHEESVLGVPPCMKYSRRWVQQISQLLIVDLQETGFDVELFVPLRHLLKEVANGEQEEAVGGVTLGSLRGEDLLVTEHGVCLARASLAVGEDGCRIAV